MRKYTVLIKVKKSFSHRKLQITSKRECLFLSHCILYLYCICRICRNLLNTLYILYYLSVSNGFGDRWLSTARDILTSRLFSLGGDSWPRITGRLPAHFLREGGWPRIRGRIPAHSFTGRKLPRRTRRLPALSFYRKAVVQEEQEDFQHIFYGKAVGQEEQEDFQHIL